MDISFYEKQLYFHIIFFSHQDLRQICKLEICYWSVLLLTVSHSEKFHKVLSVVYLY